MNGASARQGAELSSPASRLVKLDALPDNACMESDVVIIGGGLAGLSLAVGLRESPLSIAVIEGNAPVSPAGWDVRMYAVTPANVRFLESIDIWQQLDHTRTAPIRTMQIRGDAGGLLEFSAYDSGVADLAWIVESSQLQAALWQAALAQDNVSLLCPARPEQLTLGYETATVKLVDGRSLNTKLVVAADGAESWTRQAAGIEVNFKSYEELGVVANFACTQSPGATALQWFRPDGVLAWLPLPGKMMSMVWATAPEHAHELLALPSQELCRRVAEAGEQRLGALELATPAAAFPLRLMRAPCTVAHRLALIGDAAHSIHPLSGYGINLGFQDARALAEVLTMRPAFIDCGDERWLRRYERSRAEQVIALQSVTHGLRRLFRPRSATLATLRNLGLNLTNGLPVIRDALVRYAIGI